MDIPTAAQPSAELYQTQEQLIPLITSFLENEAHQLFVPSLAIDTAIFSFQNDKLKILLLRFWNTPYYCLPGGFVGKQQTLDEAAYAILRERTGLTTIYLDQFYTSGNLERFGNDALLTKLRELGAAPRPGNWLEQRFVSVCYYALLDEVAFCQTIDPLVFEPEWVDIDKLPEMLYDHAEIAGKALERLQFDLNHKFVGFNLLPEEFTMGELQKIYEAIHQTQLDRASFQRKMLSLGILERLEKKYTGKAHKSPYLYRFNKVPAAAEALAG